jgi:hypothetical protein
MQILSAISRHTHSECALRQLTEQGCCTCWTLSARALVSSSSFLKRISKLFSICMNSCVLETIGSMNVKLRGEREAALNSSGEAAALGRCASERVRFVQRQRASHAAVADTAAAVAAAWVAVDMKG